MTSVSPAANDLPAEPSTEHRLLVAAAEVFAERGYDGAGVAEIARRAGLTTGAIYSRYRGKAELLVEALDAQMARHLEAALASSTATGPTGVLATLGAHLLDDGAHDGDGLLIEAVVAARREPELAAMLERRLADERARVGKVVEEAKAAGVFDPALDGDAVMALVQSIGLGFMVFRTIGTPMPESSAWQALIDRLIAAALPPMASQPPQPDPSPPAATAPPSSPSAASTPNPTDIEPQEPRP